MTKSVVVDGLDVKAEFGRLLELREFNYPMLLHTPELRIVQRKRRPNRLAFARGNRLIHFNTYPEQDRYDVRETLTHEITHIYVQQRYGRAVQPHGPEFYRHLDAAFQEAYGPIEIGPRFNNYHGRYSSALRLRDVESLDYLVAAEVTNAVDTVGWENLPEPLRSFQEPAGSVETWLGLDEPQQPAHDPEDVDQRVLEIIRELLGVTRQQVDEAYERMYGAYPGRSAYNSIWRLRRDGKVHRTGHFWYISS